MASQDWFEKDFYAVLGVSSSATPEEVKKAYRRLARKHHPDANSNDPSAERRFKEIGEAYGVLSDPEQRQQYDAVRAMAQGGARFSAGPGGAGMGGAAFEDVLSNLFGGAAGPAGRGPGGVRFTTTTGRGGPQMDDLLGMFGGAPGEQGFRAPRPPQRGGDLTAEATISFRQSLEGALLSLRVNDRRAGVRTVRAKVPAGVKDGQKVRLRGQGRPGEPGAENGDLVITVHVEPHPVFTRDGDDLRITVPVRFSEAVLGSQIEVPTLDGGTVRVKVPAGTPSGCTLRVKGRGVKNGRRAADLLVTVQVAVPQRLDDAGRAAVEAFAQATAGFDPRAELMQRARSGAGDRESANG